ncbi:MAG: 30S ribosomal protein S12 methylthiotransferase RimO [Candidatus Cloacimonetes bacterium]|nr:30S ribosomal protein S12 methylthiotransferase RimO [Candidatus Cloacimonadota bacterium]
MKHYYLVSLGCPKNLVDSEIFADILQKAGYRSTDRIDKSDLVLINTCGFINPAKEESLQYLLESAEYKKHNKKITLIATGCLVKRYYHELKQNIKGIDHFIALKDFSALAALLGVEDKFSRKLLTPGHYAYLRISDGCSNNCSYCTIPQIRGALASIAWENLQAEAEYLGTRGVKELIITAQDITRYGTDLYGKPKLGDLIEKLHEIKDIEWIRLLYLHPAHIKEDLVRRISSLPKVCPYFDIPLQHVSNRILQSMNRRITKSEIFDLLEMVRHHIPAAEFRTTFIVGYPGETAADFSELLDFIKINKFIRLGAFLYSREEGTVAYDLKPHITSRTARSRLDTLLSVQQQISADVLSNFIGRKIEVIIDQITDDKDFRFIGRTKYDAPDIDGQVYIAGEGLAPGDIVNVNIIDSGEYDLVGQIL